MTKSKLFNIKFDVLDLEESINKCDEFLNSEKCNRLFFINAHCFNIAQKNKEYQSILDLSEIVLNDGIGIKMAAFLCGIPLKMNMNGTDFVPKLLKYSAEKGYSSYFLGGKPGITDKAKELCEKEYPNINIKGSYHGYFSENDTHDIIEKINASKAQILIVGMGVPMQEIWVNKHLSYFKNIRICIGAGAIFDFLSGNVKRAPLWMRKLGIEWVFRFYQEPIRLFKRYTVGNIQFICTILKFYVKDLYEKTRK